MAEKKLGLPVRSLAIVGVLLVLGAALAAIDLTPDLGHLRVKLLTGAETGNYHALGTRLSEAAARQNGKLEAVATHGSVDNLEQLAAPGCKAAAALVQEGIAPPKGASIELLARLPRSESLMIVGKKAGALTRFDQLRGMRIGIGPKKSGTDHLVRELFTDSAFEKLGVTLENHSVDEQLKMLDDGKLDLAAFVVDDEAALIRDALLERGLQLAPLGHLEAVARRHHHVHVGTIAAGLYDPVAIVPPRDVPVLRVDTMLVGNGCASHAETIALLTLAGEQLPGLAQDNARSEPSERLPRSATAKAFFANGGADVFETHVPWLVDVMPPSKWVYIVTAMSLLFNVMGFGHRFQLWRIDVGRIEADQRARDLLGPRLTPQQIQVLDPADDHRDPKVVDGIDAILADLAQLRDRCRRQSASALVPMGQEMAYRFHEDQIEEEITALRIFRAKLVPLVDAAPDEDDEGDA